MKFCSSCKTYTLEEICTSCEKKTVQPYPMKFSPQDPYGAYRRKLKREEKHGEKKIENK